MKAVLFVLLCSVCAAWADSATDCYPASPRVLARMIAAADRYGKPLRSRTYIQEGGQYAYYLEEASYINSIEAPFGSVHLADFEYVRSSAQGDSRPPAHWHRFLVFFDKNFRVRGCWEVDEHATDKFSVDGTRLYFGQKMVFDYAHLPPPTKEKGEGKATSKVYVSDLGEADYEIPVW